MHHELSRGQIEGAHSVCCLKHSGLPAGKTAKEVAAAAVGINKCTPAFILCLELMSNKLDLRILETGRRQRARQLLEKQGR